MGHTDVHGDIGVFEGSTELEGLYLEATKVHGDIAVSECVREYVHASMRVCMRRM